MLVRDIILRLSYIQVFLSRVRVKVGGNKLSFDTLFKKTERRFPAERRRSEGGSAPDFALTATMELLLGNNFKAKVRPECHLVEGPHRFQASLY